MYMHCTANVSYITNMCIVGNVLVMRFLQRQ